MPSIGRGAPCTYPGFGARSCGSFARFLNPSFAGYTSDGHSRAPAVRHGRSAGKATTEMALTANAGRPELIFVTAASVVQDNISDWLRSRGERGLPLEHCRHVFYMPLIGKVLNLISCKEGDCRSYIQGNERYRPSKASLPRPP